MDGFHGFGADALPFFRELGANQTRDWFQANRSRYEADVRRPMLAMLETVALRLAINDVPLICDPRRAVFRINRDVRFANDKRPYKEHVGGFLSRDGGKESSGLLYLHVGPDEAFMACGFYASDPARLALFRKAMVDRPAKWLEVKKAIAKAKLTLSRDDALTRPPRGFASDDPIVTEDLKLKNHIVSRPIAADTLADPALADTVVAFTRAALPLLRWGWAAAG